MKILIADDEHDVCTVIKHHISLYCSPFIHVKSVTNGLLLKQVCEQWEPEIVFADICMPKLSGLDAIDEIQTSVGGEEISFYIISSYSDFHYARQALKLGVKDYLLKPIRATTIHEILRSHEEHLYLGTDIQRAYALCEESAIQLSLAIQRLASTFEEQDASSFFAAFIQWKALATALNTPISVPFMYEKFNQEVGELEQQLDFFNEVLQEIHDNRFPRRSVDTMIEFVNQHFCDPSFCMTVVADRFGYSPQYLSTLFKRELSINFSTYLTSLRIEKAKTMLVIPDVLIKDIAAACGYPYSNYFIKIFSKETGLTPAEWKRAHT